VLRRAPGVRPAYRAQTADAEIASGIEHRHAVIHEQRALRREPLGCGQPRPEGRILLRRRKGVRRIARIEVPRQRHAFVLDGQGLRMRVGHQHAALAAVFEFQQKLFRSRQESHLRQRLALDAADVELQFTRPIFDAIPLQRSLHLDELRRQQPLSFRGPKTVGGRVTAGDQFQPKPIVEAQVEQCAVHIEQHRVDGRPVDRR
jgi:hypothetical protein